MTLFRVTARWGGFQGAPGYSNFFFHELPSGGDAEDARDRVRGFFTGVMPLLPKDVTVVVDGEVALVDENTGMVTSYELVDPDPNTGFGVDTGGYSAASGAVVTWLTNGVSNGRRVQGRTFVVPLAGSAYQSDGTLTSSAISSLNSGAEAMIGSGFDSGFCVWSRPSSAGGASVWPVTGWRVPDKAAVLRSRRD